MEPCWCSVLPPLPVTGVLGASEALEMREERGKSLRAGTGRPGLQSVLDGRWPGSCPVSHTVLDEPEKVGAPRGFCPFPSVVDARLSSQQPFTPILFSFLTGSVPGREGLRVTGKSAGGF